MNILLLGSGGREDALAWRLRQSPSCDRLLAAPGNPGIARWADASPSTRAIAAAVVEIAQERAASTSWSSDPRRRWSPALPTPCARPASRRSARAPPRRSSKAPKASPRTCAAQMASRPPTMSVSIVLDERSPRSATSAFRSSSRRTASPRARA